MHPLSVQLCTSSFLFYRETFWIRGMNLYSSVEFAYPFWSLKIKMSQQFLLSFVLCYIFSLLLFRTDSKLKFFKAVGFAYVIALDQRYAITSGTETLRRGKLVADWMRTFYYVYGLKNLGCSHKKVDCWVAF